MIDCPICGKRVQANATRCPHCQAHLIPTNSGSTSERLRACTFCLTDLSASATVCPSCGATRRRGGLKWTTYREGRRNDIILAGFAFLVLLWVGTTVLYTVANSSTSRSGTFSPVTTSDPFVTMVTCPPSSKHYLPPC